MYLKTAEKFICGPLPVCAFFVFRSNMVLLIERVGRSSKSETLNLKEVFLVGWLSCEFSRDPYLMVPISSPIFSSTTVTFRVSEVGSCHIIML